MVQKQADIIGMTLTWFAMSTPAVLALWLALSEPSYQWLATNFPLVIALGAPVAYVVTGFAGPRVGRWVASRFRRRQYGASRSTKITPTAGSLEMHAGAPTLLVYAADTVSVNAGNVAAKVQQVLNTYSVNVRVAPSSSAVLSRIGTDENFAIFLDASMVQRTGVDALVAIRNLLVHQLISREQVYLVRSQSYVFEAEWVKLLQRAMDIRVMEIEDFRELAAHLREKS